MASDRRLRCWLCGEPDRHADSGEWCRRCERSFRSSLTKDATVAAWAAKRARRYERKRQRDHLERLLDDWQDRGQRIAALEAERDALRAEVERLTPPRPEPPECPCGWCVAGREGDLAEEHARKAREG